MEIDYIQLITNVGFPIVVAGFLLLRMEKKLGKLEIAINNLVEAINKNGKKR